MTKVWGLIGPSPLEKPEGAKALNGRVSAGRVRLFRMVKAKVAAKALLSAVDTHAVGLNESNREHVLPLARQVPSKQNCPIGARLGHCA